jgi:choline-glycine betaine transporter
LVLNNRKSNKYSSNTKYEKTYQSTKLTWGILSSSFLISCVFLGILLSAITKKSSVCEIKNNVTIALCLAKTVNFRIKHERTEHIRELEQKVNNKNNDDDNNNNNNNWRNWYSIKPNTLWWMRKREIKNKGCVHTKRYMHYDFWSNKEKEKTRVK